MKQSTLNDDDDDDDDDDDNDDDVMVMMMWWWWWQLRELECCCVSCGKQSDIPANGNAISETVWHERCDKSNFADSTANKLLLLYYTRVPV